MSRIYDNSTRLTIAKYGSIQVMREFSNNPSWRLSLLFRWREFLSSFYLTSTMLWC